MKNKILSIVLLLVCIVATHGIYAEKISEYVANFRFVEDYNHHDGTYRGIFADGPDIQVNVQFVLEDGIVKQASFRHLRRDENYNIDAEKEPYSLVIKQYLEALAHLEGKSLSKHLSDLYSPENIVETQVDAYSSATIRSNKVVSAIRDALNRGVYSY